MSFGSQRQRLSTFFDYPQEIRRLIYTTNAVEGCHRQLRNVLKTKGAFATSESALKLLYLAHTDITKDWNASMRDWAKILNQLASLFQERFPV